MDNYDRLLVGDEKQLETYWTFDEGLRTQFFDYSRDGTNYRKHHGRIGSNAQASTLTPGTLRLKAKTDADGNYIIQGIPFSGEGSTYSIIPVYGIHEFKPAKALRFVGRNSMVHTADFEDVSWLFPSTFGVRAFIRANSMGASVSQILPEIRYLWIQAAAYLGMACLVYRYQFRLMRKATGRRASLGNKATGKATGRRVSGNGRALLGNKYAGR